MIVVPVKIDWNEFTSKIKTNCDTWTKPLSEGTCNFEELDEDYQYESFAELGRGLAKHLDEPYGKAVRWITSLLEEAGEGIDLFEYCEPMNLEDVGVPAYSPEEMAGLFEQAKVCSEPAFGDQIKRAWSEFPESSLEDHDVTADQFLHNVSCWTRILLELERDHSVLGFSIL
jgi:hypothetical protein